MGPRRTSGSASGSTTTRLCCVSTNHHPSRSSSSLPTAIDSTNNSCSFSVGSGSVCPRSPASSTRAGPEAIQRLWASRPRTWAISTRSFAHARSVLYERSPRLVVVRETVKPLRAHSRLRLAHLLLDSKVRVEATSEPPEGPAIGKGTQEPAANRGACFLLCSELPSKGYSGAKTGAVVVDDRPVGIAVDAEEDRMGVNAVQASEWEPVDIPFLQDAAEPAADVLVFLAIPVSPGRPLVPVAADLLPESNGRKAEARVGVNVASVFVPLRCRELELPQLVEQR